MDFKKRLAEKSQKMDARKLTFLNHNRERSFRQNYRTFFKSEESPNDSLKKANGVLAITETEIAEELQQTLSEGRHLREQVFDQKHFSAVSVTSNNLGTDVNNVHHLDGEVTML